MSWLALYAVKISIFLQKIKKKRKKETVFLFLHFCNIVDVFTIPLHPCQAPYQNKAMQGQAIWCLSVSSADSWHRPADLWPQLFPCVPLFARPGMGRIRAWTLLSKPIVAGFLCWLQSPNTLCFAVRMAFWCLGLLLGLADLIYMIFLYCGTSSDLPFFSTTCAALQSLSLHFLTLPLALGAAFWSLCNSRIKTESSPFCCSSPQTQTVYFGEPRLSVFVVALFRAMLGSAFCHHYILPCPSCGWFYQKQEAFL